MRGVGRATSALTVVNALPCGSGSALGIGLEAEVTVDLRSDSEAPVLFEPSDAGTPVVRAALDLAVRRFAPSGVVERLRVRSSIPSGKGLKSSSAVASATAGALAAAAEERPSMLEIARLSAEAGRRSGTSATGALDDSFAGLVEGVVVTDNRLDRLLASYPLPPGLEAIVWVPAGRHPPAPTLLEAFATERSAAETAIARARAGDWAEAMELNSLLVERVLGYAYEQLRADCRAAGAVASGVTGLGPAFAAIAEPPHVDPLVALLAARPGDIVRAPVGRGPREVRAEAT